METAPLIIEKTINASAGKVWQALTDKNKMRQWYFDVDDFEPVTGFEFRFYGENEGRKFLHVCVVTEVVINKKLTYSWSYENYPGKSFVTFELFADGNKTNIKLTHTGLETFPQDNGDFSIKNFTFGWNHIVGIALPEYVAKV